MKRFVLLLSIGMFCFGNSFAQVKEFITSPTEKSFAGDTEKFFKDVDVVDFDAIGLRSYLKNYNNSNIIKLDLGKGRSWELELFPEDVFAKDASIRIIGANGESTFPVPRNVIFRGYIKDDYQSRVLIVVNGFHLNAYVKTKNVNIVIESASKFFKKARKDQYVVYNVDDLLEEKEDKSCGNEFYPEVNVDVFDDGKSKKSNNPEKNGFCYRLDLGVISDYLMFSEKGSVQGVVNHVLDVMADVATNYELNGSTNFDDGIVYQIVEQVISTCDGCDPWSTSTNANTFLNSFTSWAQSGGFNVDVDMGSAWTNRNFDGSTKGLAWRGSGLICGNLAYHVLEDYTTAAASLRVMTAHEMGHNWNATHSTGCIMNGSVNTSTCWATVSQTEVNDQLQNANMSCLDLACPENTCDSVVNVVVNNLTSTSFNISYSATPDNSYRIRVRNLETGAIIHTQTTSLENLTVSPTGWGSCITYEVIVENNCGGGTYGPVSSIVVNDMDQGCAKFSVDKNLDWNSVTVNFTNESLNATSWDWDFGDGNSSSSQSPQHTYNTAGSYTVELSVNSGAHTMTKAEYITVLPSEGLPYTISEGGNMEGNDFATESLTAGATSLWERGVPSNYFSNSTNCWVTDLDGDMSNANNQSVLYSPDFDFSNASSATLLFDLGMEYQFCNAPFGMQVQYTTNGGNTWTRLGSDSDANWYNRGPSSSCQLATQVFSDEIGWNFNSSGGTNYSYNVNNLIGNSSVRFRWVFSNDAGWSNGYARAGAMLDNIEISAAVPVNLLAFDGDLIDKEVQLEWSTDVEINNDYFILEKSRDGNQFDVLTEVEAIDIPSSFNEYAYIDDKPYLGINYYRLTQVDVNGQSTKYKVISIFNDEPSIFKLSPNPIANKTLRFDMYQSFKNQPLIEIIDLSGRSLMKRSLSLDAGYNEVLIPLDDFKSGIYVLAIDGIVKVRFVLLDR